MRPDRWVVRFSVAVVFTPLALAAGACLVAHAQTTSDDHAVLELGRKVLAVSQALRNPRAANAMNAVTMIGRDQRYYVMLRGWPAYRLQGDRSIFEGAEGLTRIEVEERIDFLERAIRASDLE